MARLDHVIQFKADEAIFNALKRAAQRKRMTISTMVRTWILESLKREGFSVDEQNTEGESLSGR